MAKFIHIPKTKQVTESARQLAQTEGVNVAVVEGSGKEGRVVKADVEKAAKENSQ